MNETTEPTDAEAVAAVLAAPEPSAEEKAQAALTLFAAQAWLAHLVRSVTRGRTTRVADLTGRERRRVRRAMERREARLQGERQGHALPSLSARTAAVSGLEASVLAESVAVWDVPDDELAEALRDLAAVQADGEAKRREVRAMVRSLRHVVPDLERFRWLRMVETRRETAALTALAQTVVEGK